MNEIQAGPNDLLDTTDCLEAVGVFKGWKNFFFIIIVLCLLLLQGGFWLVDRGCIDLGPSAAAAEEGVTTEFAAPEIKVFTLPAQQVPAVAEPPTPVETPKPAETPEAVQPETSPPPQPAEPDKTSEPNQPADPNIASETTGELSVAGKRPVANLQRAITWPPTDFLSNITSEQFAWAIRLVNAVLVLTASLYCMTLLFGLKVSMHGRLGGINHISRAFFLSLLMLVLLLPWQMVFSGVVTGAIYTPAELIKWHDADKTGNVFNTVIYYLRFSGYGVLILLLLILSQYRSLRWARAILRRLEII
jgi:hypothetical protein